MGAVKRGVDGEVALAAPPGLRQLPAIPAADHLVVTVGGSPVPVLLTLLGLRPTTVTALVSAESTRVWQRIWSAYGGLVPDQVGVPPKVFVVPAFDVAAVAEVVAREADEVQRDGRTLQLGYSAGSPAMSAGAFQGWWRTRAGGEGHSPGRGTDAVAGAWYVAEEGDALIRHDGVYIEAPDILNGRNLTLAGMVELHGLVPVGRGSSPHKWEPHRSGVDTRGARAALQGLPRRGAPRDLAALQSAATATVLDALTLVGDVRGVDTYPPTIASEPVAGQGQGRIVGIGISAVQGLAFRMFEVAAYRRRRLVSGDVATRQWRPGPLKEAMFDAEGRARQVGGIRADTALLSLEVPERNHCPAVELLWRDVGPLTAPARLALGAVAGEPPLPSTTAFSLQELYGALLDVERRVAPAEGNDLLRWLCGVTE